MNKSMVKGPKAKAKSSKTLTLEGSELSNDVHKYIIPTGYDDIDPPRIAYPVSGDYPEYLVEAKRGQVRQYVLAKYLKHEPNFEDFNVDLLQGLFQAYDHIFYGDVLTTRLCVLKSTISFEASKKLTSVAGKCVSPKVQAIGSSYTIKMSHPIIMNTFTHGEKSLKVNGLNVYDRLQAIQCVFEHELAHLAIKLSTYQKPKTPKSKAGKKKCPIYSSHGKYFQNLVYAYYKHTNFYHHLLAETHKHRERIKASLRPGDKVSFNHKGVIKYGTVFNMNPKRVGIMSTTGIIEVAYDKITTSIK